MIELNLCALAIEPHIRLLSLVGVDGIRPIVWLMILSQQAVRPILIFQQLEFGIKLLALQSFKAVSKRLFMVITTLFIASIIFAILVFEPTRGLFIKRILIEIEVHDIGILVAALCWQQILSPFDLHGARLILQYLNLLATGSALLLIALEVKMRLLPREKLDILLDHSKTRLDI